MLVQFLFFSLLLLVLFFLCRKITSVIYSILLLITNSKKFSVAVLAFVFLPGTIVHEISHFFAASILRISTGELSIFPTIEKSGEVKTGKLMIGKSDPFRHILVGIAPILTGLLIIYFAGKLLLPNFSLPTTHYPPPATYLCLYIFFTISSTMFSSKKDLESFWIAFPITLLLLVSLYIVGVRVFLEEKLVDKIISALSSFNYFLLITAILDYLVFAILVLLLSLLRKLFRK